MRLRFICESQQEGPLEFPFFFFFLHVVRKSVFFRVLVGDNPKAKGRTTSQV